MKFLNTLNVWYKRKRVDKNTMKVFALERRNCQEILAVGKSGFKNFLIGYIKTGFYTNDNYIT
jgi:hypothetical protein